MPEIDDFTPGAAMAIAYLSVTKITGSGEPIEPLATLDKYNMKNEDTPSVKQNILNNTEFGLPHYKHKMDPNAIKDLTPGWKLQGLADVIFDNAVPVSAVAAHSFARADSLREERTAATSATGSLPTQLPTAAICLSIGFFVGLWLGSRR
jgi:hypothetical protein